MSSRNKPRPAETLELTYRKRSADIDEVYSQMFPAKSAPQPEFPTQVITSPDVLPPDLLSGDNSTSDERSGALRTGSSDISTPSSTNPNKSLGGVAIPDDSTSDVTLPNILLLHETSEIPTEAKTTRDITSGVVLRLDTTDKISPDKLSDAITSPDNLDTADLAALGRSTDRRYKLHHCNQAQDGHNTSEEMVYQVLWRAAKPTRSDDLYRVVQMSATELSAKVRITTRNLGAILLRLTEKLSIEEIRNFDRATKTSRAWRVHSYRSILQRRQAAGLEWVIRDRGVRFIDPKTSPIKTSGDVFEREAITSPDITAKSSGDKTGKTSPDKTSGSLLGHLFREKDQGNSTSDSIARALLETLGHVDDDAVARLLTGCRKVCPDATESEIVHFIKQHAPRFVRMKQIGNPMGVLLVQIPKCFAGEALKTFRSLERQRREAEAAQEAEFRDSQQRILDDPTSSEEDKQWARQILGLESS